MDRERFARLGEIFAQARDLPADRRAAFLDEACSDNAELRNEVEELLAEDSHAGDDAIDRALGDDGERTETGRIPQQIGDYRIVGVCGSGGMGTVYEAAHVDGRRVALKVIRAGASRAEMLSRFRREAKILAKLDHPCIARIYEASEVEHDHASVPFFAMEFVDGLPPLAFVRKHSLGVDGCVGIFLQICDAIEYAHQRGVVHRDLKPDNILVVDAGNPDAPEVKGVPKILDFGVAGLTDAETHVTMVTGQGQLLGSVPYMSPEQATGDTTRIGPQSDVYSLGVVLFELLAGRLPYDVRDCSLADALHTIRHSEPTRLGVLVPELRGDLETIVGKCLEKDVARRYESIDAAADDLRRYLVRRPIAAKPPSTWYQLRRFAQRNRALVGGVLATALALVVGTVVAVLFAIEAGRSADTARENQQRSDRKAYEARLEAASALLESDPAHARRVLEQVPASMRGWEWRYLSARQSGFLLEFGEVREPSARPNVLWPTNEMFLLADGEQVIAPVSDTRLCVWESLTGLVVRTFDTPAAIGCWAVSNGGGLLAVALRDGRVVTADPTDEPVQWTTWFTGDAEVLAIAVGPNGQRIAVHQDDEVRVGRPGAWRVLPISARVAVAPPLLAFAPDGSRLTVLHEGRLVAHDVETGAAVGPRIASTQDHLVAAFTADGRLASGQKAREIRCYDPSTGEYGLELLGHSKSICGLAASSGNRLLSVAFDDTIRVWDLERGEAIAVFDAPATTKAAFVDEDHILSLTGGRLRLWTLQNRRARTLRGHTNHVWASCFSADGGLLASVAPWGDTLVWDPLETAPLHRLALVPQHQNIAFDGSGEHVLSRWSQWGTTDVAKRCWAGGPATILPWVGPRIMHGAHNGKLVCDGAEGGPVAGLHVYRTEHLVTGAGAASAFVDGRAVELQPMATPIVPTRDPLGAHPSLVLGDMFTSHFAGSIAELLVYAGSMSEQEGAAIDDYLTQRRSGGDPQLPTLTSGSRARLLVHLRAGLDTLVVNDDSRLVGWAASNDRNRTLIAHGSIGGLSFEPAADGRPAQVRFYNAWACSRWCEMALPEAVGEERLTVCWLGELPAERAQLAYSIGTRALPFEDGISSESNPHRCRRLAYSKDGRYVATAGGSDHYGNVDVWDASTGRSVVAFHGQYNGISFHPDSNRIAAGGESGCIDIFDVAAGRRIARIHAHGSEADMSPCYDVAFSPDGARLASAGNDNALRLWDAATYERLLEFPGHRSYVMGVAWSPDGSMLVSACGDYQVRVWDAVPPHERYRQRLENRALEDSVRAEVDALRSAAGSPAGALAAIRERWAEGTPERRAAFKVFARVQ